MRKNKDVTKNFQLNENTKVKYYKQVRYKKY